MDEEQFRRELEEIERQLAQGGLGSILIWDGSKYTKVDGREYLERRAAALRELLTT